MANQKIINYQGQDGLKQITLNSLETKDGIRIYELKTMNEFAEKSFAEEVRQEFVKREIKIRQLTNQVYLEPWTGVEEMVEKYWEARYIDPKKFEIKTEILIYNDIVAMYDLKGENLCIEIHNQELAAMQKQIFDYFWKIGERPIIGKGGRTSLF